MNELDLHLRHDLISSKDQMAIAPEGVEIITTVDSLIARVLGINIERINNDLMYQSIREWDSLSHVTLMIALETELGTKITDQIMLQLHSVSAIREFAQTHTTHTDEGAKSAPTVTPGIKPTTVTVHRGLEGVYIERSTITNIDGERGVLEHRGYNIHDLVEQSSFEETAWLLLNGQLPDAPTLAAFQEELRLHRELPAAIVDLVRMLAHTHPMEVLRTGISALGALACNGQDESQEAAMRSGLRLIAQIPTLVATHHAIRSGREPIAPHLTFSHAKNFLYMLFGEEPSPSAVRFVDKDLIAHAEHGLNASAFAARVAIGCKANLYAAITAAIAAFSGSLHGGATERALELIDAVGTPENAEAYVRNCLERNQPVMGFGHRVYRTEDPRVRHFREAARSLSWERRDTHGLAIIEAIVKAMEPYSLHGVEPNADLYAGLTYRLLGLPNDLAVPMYVAGRIAGWIAQSLEQKSNNVLIRPRLQYVGATSRKYRLLNSLAEPQTY
ncbi:citrate/2-methylcitrate synthase [Nostoc sp. TCL240-02]|uniref:citrate/2-methylcitrate synthase n=1 Tax=Nostoc sp. TCL240-02 TaxID=2572090 RepID=UPI001C2EEABB|nr:citrate/2-methylcitrate synthase [Nostoc sp. TCL240-02]